MTFPLVSRWLTPDLLCVSDTLQCIAEMLRITKQSTGLDLLVVEKKLER